MQVNRKSNRASQNGLSHRTDNIRLRKSAPAIYESSAAASAPSSFSAALSGITSISAQAYDTP
jgi:hypothetical protein